MFRTYRQRCHKPRTLCLSASLQNRQTPPMSLTTRFPSSLRAGKSSSLLFKYVVLRLLLNSPFSCSKQALQQLREQTNSLKFD